MSQSEAEVIVAGHVCLDIIPEIRGNPQDMAALLVPGKLAEVGPAVIAAGGAVSNTGIALRRLGSRVKLMGKIGRDPFGEAILAVLRRHGESLADGMIVSPDAHSSYTIVISPPHIDRTFLHATGANDTYSAADLRAEQLRGARLMHFGYPPLMRRMYEHGGEELAALLGKAKSVGLTVSLDLARPDPASDAGRADWRAILARALPQVDVFMPSFEEILYMLRRERYEELLRSAPPDDLLSRASGDLLSELAGQLLEMGAAVVGIKLGEHGLYVRTTPDTARLAAMGACAPAGEQAAGWLHGEMLSSCYNVNVAGTTGAGDCTIAGFLHGLLRGMSLSDSLQLAVGTGACNVEQADAVSGIPAAADVWRRIRGGWSKRELRMILNNWFLNEESLWLGPHHPSRVSQEEAGG